MEAFLVSTGVVALGEIGDKTQLLALVLAARFQKPLPIIAGILVATLANHALAGIMGSMFRAFLPTEVLTWLVALSFFAVAIWALRPDRLDDGEPLPATRWGIFGVTVGAFFVAEMGDKTQVATVVLAARFPSLVAVVLIGKSAATKIPFKAVRIAAALLFVALGLYALFGPPMSFAATPAEERADSFGDPFLQVTRRATDGPPAQGPLQAPV